MEERVGTQDDAAIVAEISAERERADDPNGVFAQFGYGSGRARTEECLGLSIEQHAVEDRQASGLPANLDVVEDAPLRFERHGSDVVKTPVAGILPKCGVVLDIDRLGPLNAGSSPRLLEPMPGKWLLKHERGLGSADQEDVCIESVDQLQLAIEHGIAETGFHEHQKDGECDSRHRQRCLPGVVREIQPGEWNAARHVCAEKRSTGLAALSLRSANQPEAALMARVRNRTPPARPTVIPMGR